MAAKSKARTKAQTQSEATGKNGSKAGALTPVVREHLANAAVYQISDLFDALHEVAQARDDESSTLITAIATRGDALAGVALCSLSDPNIDESDLSEMFRTLAPHQSVRRNELIARCSHGAKSPWENRDDNESLGDIEAHHG